ncbi:Reverse transcriptase, RNA-dependent DNA polymerase [Corchorus capsularis]|uniref:Reverse transcriptase, RNA-dependent DNA polymerase n=1 Tax=Corchorus capsularis TaxID=210143 RepID=A0A1R3I490_COCAP|nr:Reverse transcriptase, RNA-dependent DNA polymerase [Corchorus capsularis]
MAATNNTPNTPISINATAQLPLKLTAKNFSSWRAQFDALLQGFDLYGYVDGTKTPPAKEIQQNGQTLTNPGYSYWLRQDKLIFHAIIASTSEAVLPCVASSKTSNDAWQKLLKLFANKTRSCIMDLKSSFTTTKRNNLLVAEYLQQMKQIVDELNLTGTVIDDDDHILYILNGLGPEFRELSIAIRARESSISYEKLYDKLVSFEILLNQEDANSNLQVGHSAEQCRRGRSFFTNQPSANLTTASSTGKSWCLDSGASHHVTADLKNLSIASDYDGCDAIQIGDGTGLPITHTGDTKLASPNQCFQLHDVLYVPTIAQNLILVSKFCKANNVSVEFDYAKFLVKDLQTQAILTRGLNVDDVYHFPSEFQPIKPVAFSTTPNLIVLQNPTLPMSSTSPPPSSSSTPAITANRVLPQEPVSPLTECAKICENQQQLISVSPLEPTTHPMVTRSRNNIVKPNPTYLMATKHPVSEIEPTCVSKAVKDPNWRAAMFDEINALLRNGTWKLLPPSPSQNLKAIYGLKQAPRAWYNALSSFLLQFGFTQSRFCLLIVQAIFTQGSGLSGYFLGIETVTTANGIFLSQKKYITDLLHRTNMLDCKPIATPMASTISLSLDVGQPLSDAKEYRSALKRVLRYLKGNISTGLSLLKSKLTSSSLYAYADADWAGDKSDRKSTSAYLVYFNGNLVSWKCNKQKTMARSSTEAEYRAIASAAVELAWIQNLLSELKVLFSTAPTIFSDNIGATYVSANPALHSKMKHISIGFHFVRDKVQAGSLQVKHVSTHDQLTDLLTKPLPRQKFQQLHSKIGVSPAASPS